MDFAVKQFRYNKKVFILPPWFEIYKTDDERKQTWEEAVNTYKILAETYRMCDYELIKVPWDSVEKRIEFVIENAGMSEPGF
jgi:predicted ATPase